MLGKMMKVTKNHVESFTPLFFLICDWIDLGYWNIFRKQKITVMHAIHNGSEDESKKTKKKSNYYNK